MEDARPIDESNKPRDDDNQAQAKGDVTKQQGAPLMKEPFSGHAPNPLGSSGEVQGRRGECTKEQQTVRGCRRIPAREVPGLSAGTGTDLYLSPFVGHVTFFCFVRPCYSWLLLHMHFIVAAI